MTDKQIGKIDPSKIKSDADLVAPKIYKPAKDEVGDLANAVRKAATEAGLNIDQKEKRRT